jgi:hypothetical protein
MGKGDAERETPDVAGKRLQAQLDVLCPNLKVLEFTHVRVFVVACVCLSVGYASVTRLAENRLTG